MPRLRFAPLRVPWRRRLQTAAVAGAFLVPLISVVFTVALIAYPPLWPVLLLVIAWLAYDYRTPFASGRSVHWLRHMKPWKYWVGYFPMDVIVEQKLEPATPYLLVVHPHGIISLGVWGNLAGQANLTQKKLGVEYHIATVWHNFMVPIWREFLMGMGFVDAGAKTLDFHLSRKKAIGVVVGGAAEALDARPGCNDLVLLRRKGFVKLALKHGAHLVPVFSFGECDLYNQKVYHRGSRVRRLLEKLRSTLGFSTPLALGRGIFNYDFGMLPHRRPLTTVIGKPIPLPCLGPHPSSDDIDKYHALYIAELEALHERHKRVHEPLTGTVSQMRIVE